MKKQNRLRKSVSFMLIALSVTVLFSCTKQKARKDIEGEWTYVSSTVNGMPNPMQITGTYTFLKCSGSDNKNGSCELVQDLIINYQGSVDTVSATTNYKIVKGQKGLELIMDDVIFQMNLTENELTLTSNENGEELIINLSK